MSYAFQDMLFAPSGYCESHAPAQINAAAVTNGFEPRDLMQDIVWADLSCGDGVNAATIAASNPNMQVHAVGDGQSGRMLAAQAGLTNVTWHDWELTELEEGSLPSLDFAVLDGGLAYLSEDERDSILPQLASALKPGGMLLLGYHALPGFAAMMPLRDVLYSLTIDQAANPKSRLRMALEWLDRGNADDFGFLAEHTGVRHRLEAYGRLHHDIAATELFGGNLVPFHFAQISSKFSDAGLHFAGNSILHLNMLDLALPPSLRPVLKGVKSRQEFEALRDMLRNTFYRRDIYVRGAPLTDTDTFLNHHGNLLVANTAGDYRTEDKTVDFGGFTVNFDGFPFSTIHENLLDGPMQVDDIPDVISGIARDAVRSALGAGLLLPCARLGNECEHDDILRIPDTYNRVVLSQASNFETHVPLASPVLGGALHVEVEEALVLGAIAETQCSLLDAEDSCVSYLSGVLDAPEDDNDAKGDIRAMVISGIACLTPSRLKYLAQLGIVT